MAEHTRLDREADEDLLDRIASGETAALEVLFRRRQQNVYRFALHLTGSPSMADDVTQDVFVTVIRDAARFEHDFEPIVTVPLRADGNSDATGLFIQALAGEVR